MKLGCIRKDIDGMQRTASSLFGDDGVVTFTSRLLATVFKEFSANMSKVHSKSHSTLAAWA